ncbi:MAG TPA: NYN domain-containing protein [Acidobacteriota bacterium]|nr:NYN domain-containing protein [Acidobacteriota bacterium]
MLRMMIFIDGSNLYHESDRFTRGMRVDFQRLRDELSSGFDLVRTFYYASAPPNATAEQLGFFKKLGYLGFKVRVKPLHETIAANGRREWQEKGVDVALATELVANGMRHTFDWATIVSGDQDLCEAVEQVQSCGLRVQVAFFRHALAEELKLRADRFLYLDDMIDRIAIKTPESKARPAQGERPDEADGIPETPPPETPGP